MDFGFPPSKVNMAERLAGKKRLGSLERSSGAGHRKGAFKGPPILFVKACLRHFSGIPILFLRNPFFGGER